MFNKYLWLLLLCYLTECPFHTSSQNLVSVPLKTGAIPERTPGSSITIQIKSLPHLRIPVSRTILYITSLFTPYGLFCWLWPSNSVDDMATTSTSFRLGNGTGCTFFIISEERKKEGGKSIWCVNHTVIFILCPSFFLWVVCTTTILCIFWITFQIAIQFLKILVTASGKELCDFKKAFSHDMPQITCLKDRCYVVYYVSASQHGSAPVRAGQCCELLLKC